MVFLETTGVLAVGTNTTVNNASVSSVYDATISGLSLDYIIYDTVANVFDLAVLILPQGTAVPNVFDSAANWQKVNQNRFVWVWDQNVLTSTIPFRGVIEPKTKRTLRINDTLAFLFFNRYAATSVNFLLRILGTYYVKPAR